jgi:8-oxo-dGTP pyrophosphatase MutT (NUDIX family)
MATNSAGFRFGIKLFLARRVTPAQSFSADSAIHTEVDLSKLKTKLTLEEPAPSRLRYAAVAIIIRGESTPEVLLIKRAEHSGDPWSGQIAFPGGKSQPDDGTLRRTAARETLEEVGIDLSAGGDFLGYGGPTTTHTGSMDVVPAVFALKGDPDVILNEEVASSRWVKVEDLLSPESKSTYTLGFQGRAVEMPAIIIGEYLIWGLTYRILAALLGVS